jgi:RimK family alpha-L-glutamate ligase
MKTRIGILTRNKKSWCSSQLRRALDERNIEAICFNFTDLVARVNEKPYVSFENLDLLKDLSAMLVRPIGRCSLEEIIFQLDLLHKLYKNGLKIINQPSAIEKAADKYYTLSILEESGLPVPKTIATRNIEESLKAFRNFGGEAIIKPLFGSKGIGTARISDIDVAERTFRTLKFYRHVIYIQEFIPHQNKDVRAFVIGDEVTACMQRIANSWKTNVSKGAKPIKMDSRADIENLSIKAAQAIGCEVAGVDLIETEKGPIIIEINSQPGWSGLQSTTDVDIAGKIIDYVVQQVKR